MDTNTGESPGYQSQSLWPRNSPSEEVRGHWVPTGAELMERWTDGWIKFFKTKKTYFTYKYSLHIFLNLYSGDIFLIQSGIVFQITGPLHLKANLRRIVRACI